MVRNVFGRELNWPNIWSSLEWRGRAKQANVIVEGGQFETWVINDAIDGMALPATGQSRRARIDEYVIRLTQGSLRAMGGRQHPS